MGSWELLLALLSLQLFAPPSVWPESRCDDRRAANPSALAEVTLSVLAEGVRSGSGGGQKDLLTPSALESGKHRVEGYMTIHESQAVGGMV